MHINLIMCDRLKSSIGQLKGKILESITLEFHPVKNIHHNSYNKSFNLTKKRHIRKFDEPINKEKGTHCATKGMGY